MTRIAILTRTITTANAVSNDVVGMSGVLTNRGHEVRVYADEWTHPELRVRHAMRINDFLQDTEDVLIYHYSIGWGLALDLLNELNCRTVVKYHNITPAQFFDGIDEYHVEMCLEGRQQMKIIARSGCDLYLADSAFNMQELIAEGTSPDRCFVVPPFHHIDRLLSINPAIDILDKYTDGKVNILMVGRVSPNKGHIALLEAFATYYYHYNSNSRLILVGIEREVFKAYSQLIREMASLLGVEGAVIFAGEVPDEELKAFYLVSNAFMFASEHEGFCVPLVEAMALKLPIIAYASTAIPGTVGEAGLVWETRDPYLLAQSLDLIARDESVGVAMGLKAQRRYEEMYTNEKIEAEFLRALDALL
ncbi:MAG: glycosyltransferase family 4 protein [Acidobacteria bacterium]|nr:glycosyltransferase family 4 protein [Acidobacteriota bacterium]